MLAKGLVENCRSTHSNIHLPFLPHFNFMFFAYTYFNRMDTKSFALYEAKGDKNILDLACKTE